MAAQKLIFMGTPAFALPTLEALMEAGHEIVAVYTQPPRPAGRGQKETPSPVHDFAKFHGLKVLTPASLKSPEEQQVFASHGADAVVVVAYGLLLPKEILHACRLGCLNLHPSLLPRWRGAAPLQRTIMAGDTESAVCIMQMDEGLDTGGILLMERFPIERMNSKELHDHCAALGATLMTQAVRGLCEGSMNFMPQTEDGVTYASKILKEEGLIDWKKSTQAIDCLIRGLAPSPGAYFLYGEEKIKVLAAQPLEYTHSTKKPGITLDDQLIIGTGDGAIHLLEVQRPGKKPMQVEEMLRGYPIPAGVVLE